MSKRERLSPVAPQFFDAAVKHNMRLAVAAERRRIRRALRPLRAALVSAALLGTGPYGAAQNKAEARKLLDMLDRATKAPKRKTVKEKC